MKKGYWIVAYKSIGADGVMKSYGELAGAALASFRVRLLTSPTSEVTALEEGLKQMTVVVEFESYSDALAAYKSAGYQEALSALGASVTRDFRIVEGV